jgi:hypothetical protein
MEIKYEDIKPYIEKKLVSEQAHPENGDVRIFNYTQHCQFEQTWDDITRQCRGLIMNVKTGEILARPFPKFFNYGEHVSKGWAIPTTKPKVYEKLDGSLGILYVLNGRPAIATRGSFTSDQAIWATHWYRANCTIVGQNVLPPKDETFLFEIIYPENRIVVNYDFSGLVFLASIDIRTGKQIPRKMQGTLMNMIRDAKEIPYTDMPTLEKMDEPNSEGFVLFYPEENVRMKIKFPEYVRLHRIITGVNEIALWEMLRDDKPFDELLEKVPDEFHQWVKNVVNKLVNEYNAIVGQCYKDRIKMDLTVGDDATRKEIALFIQKNCQYPSVMFAKLDNKPLGPIIWRMLRPSGAKVFKTDIDL